MRLLIYKKTSLIHAHIFKILISLDYPGPFAVLFTFLKNVFESKLEKKLLPRVG
jgi:hypothetical protein